MDTPKFLYCSNPEAYPDQDLILCTEQPYAMARVMRFKNEWKAMEFEQNNIYTVIVKCPEHHIYFCLMGSIKGSRLSVDSNWEEKYTALLNEMREFYERTKMRENPYQYNKYKIKYN